jgi:hypothetical protein
MEQWPPGVDGRGRFVGMGRDRSKGFGFSWCPQEAVCDRLQFDNFGLHQGDGLPEREMSAANQEISLFFTTINNASPMLCERNARQLGIHSGNALL